MFQHDAEHTTQNTPTCGNTDPTGIQAARRCLQLRGYTTKVAETILQSRRASSTKVYSYHISRWIAFCAKNNCDATRTTIPRILEFLQLMVDQHFSYSSIAKAAVNTCVILPNGEQLGLNVNVRAFLRGVFNIRPLITQRTSYLGPGCSSDIH